VFIGVLYNAQLDADGNPVKGPDGRFVKADLRGYAVMEKRKGWGTDYPEDKRNGEWEYRAFKADKTPNEQINLGVCFDWPPTTGEAGLRPFLRQPPRLQRPSEHMSIGCDPQRR
jgi:hypothetical protein